MATLAELAAARAGLDEATIDHLLRLTASWSLLADLAFSDLVLMAPEIVGAGAEGQLVVLGQVRPNNRATVITADLVGTAHRADDWPLVRRALAEAERVTGYASPEVIGEPTLVWAIPVRVSGAVVAALVRLQGPMRGPSSLYEQAYLSIFVRLCDMVAASTFPFREDDVAGPGLPRVGDGIILLDGAGRVDFATPNAVNALHRVGVSASVEGRTLPELGLHLRALERARAFAMPTLEELDRGIDVAIVFHCVPLLEAERPTAVMVLVRDVSDLRRLNRVVLSKEAAVREVHHRVKNNLQTISSLLRLQARRSVERETRTALLEAERRVRSIAVVHEVLSREPGEDVSFDEIVRSLVLLVEDTVLALHPVEIVVSGELGVLATDVATPLAVVLAELLTNAVEHAFVDFTVEEPDPVGVVTLRLARDGEHAVAEVRDNGVGVGADFSLDAPTSLGLSIVRDLVRTQLRGQIDVTTMGPESGGGTLVRVEVPLVAWR